jgi:hypothetical protein
MTVTVDKLEARLAARRKNFLDWLKQNPDVWKGFVELSFKAIKAGRQHYSAWLVAAVIRYNQDIKSQDGEFKISNERIGWLARFFHYKYPHYKGFYATRPLKEEKMLTELKSHSNVILLHR